MQSATPRPHSDAQGREELLRLQLCEAYKAVRTTYQSALQFITIAAGAEVASLTLGVELKSALILLVGGLVVTILIYQLVHAGRAFSSTVVTALAIENELGLDDQKSLVSGFYGGAYGKGKLDELKRIALSPPESSNSNWLDETARHALFRFGFTTTIALFLGISQIIISVVLMIIGWD